LTGENQQQIIIPRGFAHGFAVLSDTATVLYKCDNLYYPESERGIHYADPGLNIDWKLAEDQVLVSVRDAAFPRFSEAEMNFNFED
jgi:dTDP-4-dehydrorhamnose 3,5-epimerase